MLRKIIFTGGVMVCGLIALTGCNKEDPVGLPDRTVMFTTGFEETMTGWDGVYQESSVRVYQQMTTTTDAAHSGTKAVTTDSNMTGLCHREPDRVESGIAGAEFYMKAQILSGINFGLLVGQNPGSSGAVSPSFGIFFDPADSIKCTFYNTFSPELDVQTMVAPIIADHWYKCNIEVNIDDSLVSYFLDDVLMHSAKTIKALYGIDRLVVLRGKWGKDFAESTEGKMPYYIDDITFYKK